MTVENYLKTAPLAGPRSSLLYMRMESEVDGTMFVEDAEET